MSRELEQRRASKENAARNGQHADDVSERQAESTTQSDPVARRIHPFYALTFRNFRLFFVGQIISVAGTWMQSVAQNWFVWQLTHSAAWLGIVNGASAIPFVLFAIWGGQIADRYSRRNILVWTQSAMMLLAFAMAVLATNHWIPAQAWHVALISALTSIANAFNMPAQQAFVTDMVEDREALSNAIALNSLRFNLARFVGPILAGIVLYRYSAAACFFLNGLSFIAVIVSLMMMRLPAVKPRGNSVSVWEGFRFIAENRSVLRIVIMVGLGAVFTWSSSTLYPVFATLLHRGAGGYSTMMSANGVGAALGGLALAFFGDRFSRRIMIYGGALLFSIALVFFAAATNFYWSLTILMVSGFAMIIFGISSNTKVQEDVPDALRGRVMAVYTLVFNGMFPLGGLEIGFLAEHLSAPASVRINAIISIVITAAVWLWSRLDRPRRPTSPVPN